MDDDRFAPREVGKRLGISTATLRRYVSNFTHFFSASARRHRDRRYTSGDINVFKGIQRLGDKIAFISPSLATDHLMGADEPEVLLNDGPAALERLVLQFRELRDHVSTLSDLSQLEWILLLEMQERIQQRLDLVAARVRAKSLPSIEYRRIASSPTWHWVVACPDYPRHHPRGARFVARKSLPRLATLCPICSRMDTAI